MEKSGLETAFQNGGLRPVAREKMGNYDLFIGDGFSSPPHFRYQRFGIDPGDFPAGMYVTFWWLGKDEKLHIGRPMFLEPTEIDLGARLNAARADAKKALKKLRKN